jgi:hypothetical protein
MTEPLAPRFGGNRRAIAVGLGLGAIGFAALFLVARHDARSAAFAYLVAYAFGFTIALGSLALLMIGHAVNASWIIVIRRPIETAAATLPVFALLFLPVVLWLRLLYPWVGPASGLSEHTLELIRGKQAYLNTPAFLGRAAFYLAFWSALALALRHSSVAGDRDAATAVGLALRAKTLSAAGFIPLALTLTFASFDWIMSLDPTWFSSMFGIYVFAGGFAASLAVEILLVASLDRARLLSPGLHPSHYQALGKLLLTSVIFWAYIAYFQGLLIWIADIPEESSWYVHRSREGWGTVLALLAIAHFALPFAALLSRDLKRHPVRLATVAVLVLSAHYLDVSWLVLPADGGVRSWPAVACFAALLAVIGPVVAFGGFLLAGASSVPDNDPRLSVSLEYSTL